MAEADRIENITLDLGLVVQEGFYVNRTDFLRTAVRAQRAVHADTAHRTVERKTIVLGLESYSHQRLEEVRSAGRQQQQIRVLGLATRADNVTPELAIATIDSVEVLGVLRVSTAVKVALRDRIR